MRLASVSKNRQDVSTPTKGPGSWDPFLKVETLPLTSKLDNLDECDSEDPFDIFEVIRDMACPPGITGVRPEAHAFSLA
jgi:hypothetical protein